MAEDEIDAFARAEAIAARAIVEKLLLTLVARNALTQGEVNDLLGEVIADLRTGQPTLLEHGASGIVEGIKARFI